VAVTAPKTRFAQPAALQDEAAFESAFLEHYPRVFSVLFRVMGDRAEAEDLTLEAFWQLWQRPPRERSAGVGGWLYRVALRLGYNALRAGKRRARYEEHAGRDALEQNAPPNPAQEAETAFEQERARAILREMPEREAQLLILRYSGLAYKDIASALNIAPGSVGTLLARAEKEFEKRFKMVNGKE
jgi:RNA polymerase sigma-70 factor (ECF subfamily)